MNARVDALLDEALMLAADERSALALALLDSIDGDNEDVVSQAWADEIRRRKAAMRADPGRAIPWAEARARLSTL